MATSTIPEALDALVTAFAGLSEVTVHDGRPVTQGHKDFICVGYDGGDSTEAVEFSQEPAAIARGSHPRREEYDVLCILSAGSGDNVASSMRTRAFALLAEVENSLRPDPSLGVTGVQTMQLVSGTVLQFPTAVDIRFRVQVRARI